MTPWNHPELCQLEKWDHKDLKWGSHTQEIKPKTQFFVFHCLSLDPVFLHWWAVTFLLEIPLSHTLEFHFSTDVIIGFVFLWSGWQQDVSKLDGPFLSLNGQTGMVGKQFPSVMQMGQGGKWPPGLHSVDRKQGDRDATKLGVISSHSQNGSTVAGSLKLHCPTRWPPPCVALEHRDCVSSPPGCCRCQTHTRFERFSTKRRMWNISTLSKYRFHVQTIILGRTG